MQSVLCVFVLLHASYAVADLRASCEAVCALQRAQATLFNFQNGQLDIARLLERVVGVLGGGCDGLLIMDVGANVGDQTGMLGREIPRICGASRFTALLFEANPLVVKHLRESLAHDSRMIVIGKGVTSNDSLELPFFAPAHEAAFQGGTLAKIRKTTAYGDGVQKALTSIRCTTIDTEMTSLRDDQDVAFLKVDVEGHEHDVFMGAVGLLQRRRVPVVVYECHGSFNEQEWAFPANVNFFSSFGFDNWLLAANGVLLRLDWPYFSPHMWAAHENSETNCVAIDRAWQHYDALLQHPEAFIARAILQQQKKQGETVKQCNCFRQDN
jgi:FkbM family methyltransferase